MASTSMTRRAAAALAGLLLASAAQPGLTQGSEKIRVAFVPTASFLPLWVAKEQGIFARHGLDAELTPIQNLSLLPGAAGKQFEIIPSTTPDLLKAIAGGIGITAIGALVIDEQSNSMTKIVVGKDSGITDIKQLAGKTVATPSIGAISNIAFLAWLKKAGVDVKTVKIVEVPYPNMGDQLKAGRVDAIQSIQPFMARHIAEGNVALGSHLLAVQDPALFVFWAADAAWAAANGKALAKWDKAMEEALKSIKADEKAARAVLAQYTKLPQPIADSVQLPSYRFSIDAKEFAPWEAVLRDLGQLSAPVDPAKLVQTTR